MNIGECAPLVIPGAVTPAEAQWLREHLDRTYSNPANVSSICAHLNFGPIDAAEDPSEYHHRLHELACLAGDHFGIEAPFVNPTLLRYNAGSHHPGHKDRNPEITNSGWITLALSILLSDPFDFTGGTYETKNEGPIAVELGDAIAATSETRRRVTAIGAGRRYVLVAFCGELASSCNAQYESRQR